MPGSERRWKPDDSFHDIIGGEFKGVKRVKDALAELHMGLGDRIMTSRDKKLQPLVEKLRRKTLPSGFEQWQVPVVLGSADRPAMLFITIGIPRATIPLHSHRQDSVFRIVLSGSIVYRNQELLPGDWMYVPMGRKYSLRAGRMGVVMMHIYNPPPLRPVPGRRARSARKASAPGRT